MIEAPAPGGAALPAPPPAAVPAAPQNVAAARAAVLDPANFTLPADTPAANLPEVPAATPSAPEMVRDEAGRLRDPATGQFVSTEPAPAAAPEAPAGEAAPAEPPAAEAPQRVRVDLPEALRERGRDSIEVAPEYEREIRALVNGYTRRAEVERLNHYAQQVEEHAAGYRAQADAYWELLQVALTDPNLGEEVRQIRELLGDEAASRHLQGLLQQAGGKITERVGAYRQEAAAARMEQRAISFAQEAYQAARASYPLWSDGEIQRALGHYATYLELNGGQDYSMQEFFNLANSLYLQNPRVQEEAQRRYQANQTAERERLAQELRAQHEAQERQKLAEAANRRSTNPLAGAPSAVRTGVTVPAVETRPTSVQEARRALRPGA